MTDSVTLAMVLPMVQYCQRTSRTAVMAYCLSFFLSHHYEQQPVVNVMTDTHKIKFGADQVACDFVEFELAVLYTLL